jgi:hypothetical protein
MPEGKEGASVPKLVRLWPNQRPKAKRLPEQLTSSTLVGSIEVCPQFRTVQASVLEQEIAGIGIITVSDAHHRTH